MKPQETTNYELLGKGWATRAPVAQTLQSMRQTCLRTTTTCAYTFARFPFSGKVKPTRASPVKQRLEHNNVTAPVKPQEPTNYELLGKGWATRAPVAQTLQSVRQTCTRTTTTCAYTFAQVPFSGTFTPTRTSPVQQRLENNNVIGAGETSRNDKLRVAWERLGNTRARRAITAKRAPSMLTHHHHVRVHVCTVSIQ